MPLIPTDTIGQQRCHHMKRNGCAILIHGRKIPSNPMTEEEIEDWKKMWENAEKIYVSAEAYDRLVEILNRPPDPKVVARLRELMNKPAPWDKTDDE
jgi:hypothetical protein